MNMSYITVQTAANVWSIWASTSATTATNLDYYAPQTVSTATTLDYIWASWTSDVESDPPVIVRREPTAEETAAAEATQRRYNEARRDLERRKAEADARAEVLLREILSPRQRTEYDGDKSFTVVGSSGKRYRIRRGQVANVDALQKDSARVDYRLCAHPAIVVPTADTMLAQKMMLEHDAEAFERTANRRAAAA